MMSTKRITAGDILRVGDLTDEHLGAVIEVGPVRGVTYRLQLDRVVHDGSGHAALQAAGMEVKYAHRLYAVTVITPPPVVQPDEPTEFGQCIHIEGDDDDWLGVVIDPQDESYAILDTDGDWWHWGTVLIRAAGRRIIVSDPPRWPDENMVAPEVPEVLERISGLWTRGERVE